MYVYNNTHTYAAWNHAKVASDPTVLNRNGSNPLEKGGVLPAKPFKSTLAYNIVVMVDVLVVVADVEATNGNAWHMWGNDTPRTRNNNNAAVLVVNIILEAVIKLAVLLNSQYVLQVG